MTESILILNLLFTIADSRIELSPTIEESVSVLEKNTETTVVKGPVKYTNYLFWDEKDFRPLIAVLPENRMIGVRITVTEYGWGYMSFFDIWNGCHRLIKFDKYVEIIDCGYSRINKEEELFRQKCEALDIPWKAKRGLKPVNPRFLVPIHECQDLGLQLIHQGLEFAGDYSISFKIFNKLISHERIDFTQIISR